MNNGRRTAATLLAVAAVMLGLNLIVRGSPTAVAAPPVPEPTVVAGAVSPSPVVPDPPASCRRQLFGDIQPPTVINTIYSK